MYFTVGLSTDLDRGGFVRNEVPRSARRGRGRGVLKASLHIYTRDVIGVSIRQGVGSEIYVVYESLITSRHPNVFVLERLLLTHRRSANPD